MERVREQFCQHPSETVAVCMILLPNAIIDPGGTHYLRLRESSVPEKMESTSDGGSGLTKRPQVNVVEHICSSCFLYLEFSENKFLYFSRIISSYLN